MELKSLCNLKTQTNKKSPAKEHLGAKKNLVYLWKQLGKT